MNLDGKWAVFERVTAMLISRFGAGKDRLMKHNLVVAEGCYNFFLFRFAAVKGSGKISTLAKPGTARTVICLLLIVFSQLQSVASYSNTSVKPTKKKNSKEYTIKSSMILPSSTKVEVINQELPWSEELHFKTELKEKLVVDFTCIIKGFFPDLFRVIAPSNAP